MKAVKLELKTTWILPTIDLVIYLKIPRIVYWLKNAIILKVYSDGKLTDTKKVKDLIDIQKYF